MTRLSWLLGLAVLAEAGIALLAGELPAPALRALAYAALGGIAALGTAPIPPFFGATALGIVALGAVLVRDAVGSTVGHPLIPLIGPASAMAGATLGHFVPRLANRFGHGLRGLRGAERRPGAGLTVRIGARAYPVRDWSPYGLFVEAPQDRFKPGQEVVVDLDLDPNAPPVTAEVLRLGGTGVALRFVAVSADDRARLQRRFLESFAA